MRNCAVDEAWYIAEPPEHPIKKPNIKSNIRCTSFACSGANVKGVVKEVKGRPDYCPDCGSALFYEREIIYPVSNKCLSSTP